MFKGKQILWTKSFDWTLKNVTKGNQETFLSTHPTDWHKTASPWLPTESFTICHFKPLVERLNCSRFADHVKNRRKYYFPPLDRVTGYLSLLHTAGTIREQIC